MFVLAPPYQKFLVPSLAPSSGAIFRELRVLLALHFVVKDICYVSRSCNQCAHELARFSVGRDPGSPHVWDDPLPYFVKILVDRDRTDLLVSE
jgi:hypothetical protein